MPTIVKWNIEVSFYPKIPTGYIVVQKIDWEVIAKLEAITEEKARDIATTLLD